MTRLRLVGLVGGVIILVIVVVIPLLTSVNPVVRVIGFYSDHVHGPWYYGFLAHRYSTTFRLPGLHSPVTVVYDKNGVPHIFAETEIDAYTVLGWIQASDRFWQMDVMRRIAWGNLSALVGPAALQNDIIMRTLGYPKAVKESYRLLKIAAAEGNIYARKALAALEAYTRGVNEWLKWAKQHNAIPIEYRLLGIQPEPWKPEDSLAVAHVIIHGLAFSRSDVLVAALASHAGSWLVGLFLDAKKWLSNATIIPGSEWKQYTGIARTLSFKPKVPIATPSEAKVSNHTYTLEILKPYLKALKVLAKNLPLPFSEPGFSNNWIISGRLTTTGYPILANDPHLELIVPPVWYEFHIVAVKDGLNAYGVGFPGVPFVIIGRNEHVAVGYTNSMIDVVDYYFYVWKDNTTYYYKGRWLKVKVHEELIPVYNLHGGYSYYRLKILETVHGPILEFHIGNRTVRLAVKTTTTIPSLIVVWAYMVTHAKTVYDVLKAQQYFYAPIQNNVAADDKGNILYSPTGLIPIRTNLPKIVVDTPEGKKIIVNYGFLPFNGSRGEGEWLGFLPFNSIPRLLNPREGFVVTANNYIVSDYEVSGYPAYLQFTVCDRYRFMRIKTMIEQILASKGRISIDDVKAIQTDYRSLAEENILELVYKLTGRRIVKGWDYIMRADDYRPTISFEFILQLHKLLWSKLFKEAGLKPDFGCGGVRLELTEYVLREAARGNTWYLEKLGVKNIEELVDRAWRNTVRELSKLYGTSSETKWVWGVKHRYTIEHLLGKVFPWLNYPSYPAPGDPYTVNPSPETRIGEGVRHGPSVRFIADMRPGAEPAGYMQLPGGNIDNPFSIFFDNQLEGWVKGQYHPIWMYKSPTILSKKAGTSFIYVFTP